MMTTIMCTTLGSPLSNEPSLDSLQRYTYTFTYNIHLYTYINMYTYNLCVSKAMGASGVNETYSRQSLYVVKTMYPSVIEECGHPR
jgi:hypothetical protein